MAEHGGTSGRPQGARPFTIEDLVRIGDQVVRGLAELGNVGSLQAIPGCCTQGCCDGEVLRVLDRR